MVRLFTFAFQRFSIMTLVPSRRRFLQSMAAGFGAVSASGWFPSFAQALANDPNRRRHCILLWMSGGPSQTDTFDMKPGHENGGEFKEIQTAVPGLRFSEHLPKLAAMSDKLAILRGLSTKEGDHGRGTYLMRTGYKPMGPIQYPCIGASLAKQLAEDELTLPSNVSIGTYRAFNQDAFSPGFLGPRFGPLFVGATDMPGAMTNDESGFPRLEVQSLRRAEGISEQRMEQRSEDLAKSAVAIRILATSRSGRNASRSLRGCGPIDEQRRCQSVRSFPRTESVA